MATIYIDKKAFTVSKSDNLLKACLSLGFDIPYFCWHPALGSIGVCRQCAIKQYKNLEDVDGRIVMSCMTPATDGTVISILDNEVRQFRKSIAELLMINHPHDCPVCEEGGSCHLQDMTVMTGQYFRRYRFNKRTHFNQNLGPFISHEMNRCIVCYRCVRYYKNYADGNDLGVYGAHDNIYFGRVESGTLESEFSGNLIEICPTGVFTDKTYSKHYYRKWDMQFAPSICHQCSVGCNISPGERNGKLCRIENRYNGSINQYFLCDRGRFGYGYVNLKDRPRSPSQRYGDVWTVLTADQAIQSAAGAIRHAHKVIGIGSPRASIESNFALRELVGAENFYSCINHDESKRLALIINILSNGGIYTPSLHEIESYDAVLLLGEDLTQTGARIALAVRQAVKGKAREIAMSYKIEDWQAEAISSIGQYSVKYPLFITNVDRTRLDDIASWTYYAPADDQARLGFAIAHAIDKQAPAVAEFNKSLDSKVNLIVQALLGASKPLIISGTGAGNKAIITAATNVALALKNQGSNVGISFVVPDANSMGLAMIGGGHLEDALTLLEQNVVDNMIILENDLYRYAPATRVDAAISNVNNIIVLDHQYTSIQKKANLILPAASFAEGSGTIVNQEGRAQRFFQVYNPMFYDKHAVILESWRWLTLLRSAYLNCQTNICLDSIIDAAASTMPKLKGIKFAAPDSSFRIHGQKLAREPHRYSGRTAMFSNISVHEPRVSQDHDTMFTFSMEGNNSPQSPRREIAFAWAPGWNSNSSWNKFQDEIGGHLRYGDPGVRLLEPGKQLLNYFNLVPSAFTKFKNGNWRIAAYWHLFGSEETSQRSPVIKEIMALPYVAVNYMDAIQLGINSGTLLKFTCKNIEFCLPARISDNLSSGQLGLPLGLPGIPLILAEQNAFNLRKVV